MSAAHQWLRSAVLLRGRLSVLWGRTRTCLGQSPQPPEQPWRRAQAQAGPGALALGLALARASGTRDQTHPAPGGLVLQVSGARLGSPGDPVALHQLPGHPRPHHHHSGCSRWEFWIQFKDHLITLGCWQCWRLEEIESGSLDTGSSGRGNCPVHALCSAGSSPAAPMLRGCPPGRKGGGSVGGDESRGCWDVRVREQWGLLETSPGTLPSHVGCSAVRQSRPASHQPILSTRVLCGM